MGVAESLPSPAFVMKRTVNLCVAEIDDMIPGHGGTDRDRRTFSNAATGIGIVAETTSAS
jgi:hypothetical protein